MGEAERPRALRSHLVIGVSCSTERIPGRNRNASVTIAPSTPAPTSVRRAPARLATGPVNANESGSRPMEMNQSRLDTRPSSCRGTRRCFVVTHTMVPAVSSALKRKHASMACHGAWASPKPATASVDSVHATYMNVMNFRGDLRCPMKSAAPIAPTPPIARMNPKVNGLPPQWSLTSRGSSTSCGPMNNR